MKTTAKVVKTTKTNQPYHLFTLENGKNLSVFNFDARFAEIDVGTDIPDTALEYNPEYDNYKLKPLPRGPQVKSPSGYKPIAAAMEKKNENIQAAQERKNDAIAKAGAFRDATLVSLAELQGMPFPDAQDFKDRWEYWVKYFLAKHDEPFI